MAIITRRNAPRESPSFQETRAPINDSSYLRKISFAESYLFSRTSLFSSNLSSGRVPFRRDSHTERQRFLIRRSVLIGPAVGHSSSPLVKIFAIEGIFHGGCASFSKVSGERRSIGGDKETAKQYISFGRTALCVRGSIAPGICYGQLLPPTKRGTRVPEGYFLPTRSARDI